MTAGDSLGLALVCPVSSISRLRQTSLLIILLSDHGCPQIVGVISGRVDNTRMKLKAAHLCNLSPP